MPSESEQILRNLNSKQKPVCQLATVELLPNDMGKQQINDKSAFVSGALDLWFLVDPTTRSFIS